MTIFDMVPYSYPKSSPSTSTPASSTGSSAASSAASSIAQSSASSSLLSSSVTNIGDANLAVDAIREELTFQFGLVIFFLLVIICVLTAILIKDRRKHK